MKTNLSLRWAHSHFVGFVTRRLNYQVYMTLHKYLAFLIECNPIPLFLRAYTEIDIFSIVWGMYVCNFGIFLGSPFRGFVFQRYMKDNDTARYSRNATRVKSPDTVG